MKVSFPFVIFYFITIFCSDYSTAQILPKPESKLNYTQVLFKHPPYKNASYYKFYLSELDSINAKESISTKIVTDSTSITIINDFNFGKSYKWHVVAFNNKGKKLNKSRVFQFSILKNDYGDTSRYRVKQFYNDKKNYQNGIIWLDKYCSALDRNGKIVWQFPRSVKTSFSPDNMVDLHMCNNGNITLSFDTCIYYISKDLEVIWKKNVSDLKNTLKVSYIHHVFTQLPNGNFLALASTYEKFKLNETDTTRYKYENHIILEFDENGKLIWNWEMRHHFDMGLIKSHLKKYGSRNSKMDVMLHANSLAYDSTYNHLFMGFRDFNRFIKIDRKTGNVIGEYGQKLTDTDTNVFETNFFSKQHDVKPIGPNTILLFNNGEDDAKSISSVQILKLPTSRSEKVEKIWEMDLTIDSLPGKAVKYGSVQKLSNGNFLIGGGMNGRILEVTADKKPVWDLYLQGRMMTIFKWGIFAQYRAYFNSSLYPYYFSLLPKDNNLYLHNEGTDKDQYLIETFSTLDYQSTLPKKTITTNFINPNTNFIYELDLNDTKIVKVTSLQAKTVEVINLTSGK